MRAARKRRQAEVAHLAAAAESTPGAGGPDNRGHEARRAGVLAAAAREFNARGIGRASFARIARELGITRAALYYYVKDRQDLVRQCYARSCAAMAADLDAAENAPTTSLNRVLAFLRASLDPERAPLAVLSELDYLTGEARVEIAAAHAANIARLRRLIREGASDGSLRPCDDEAVAQALVGVIAWVPLSVDWLEGKDPTYRPRTVDALCDLIANGLAVDPSRSYTPPISVRTFVPPPRPHSTARRRPKPRSSKFSPPPRPSSTGAASTAPRSTRSPPHSAPPRAPSTTTSTTARS